MGRKKSGTMTKTEAVKEAIANGAETPTDGVAYIREKFGLEVTNQQFSTYKSLAKKAAEESAPAEQTAPAAETSTAVARPAPRAGFHANGTSGDAATLALSVKNLVAQYGADAVKRMTDVFAE